MKQRIRVALGWLALSAACATGAEAKDAEPKGDFSGAMVTAGPCAFAQDPARKNVTRSLRTGLAAAAISLGVNQIGKAIAGAAAAKTWSSQASHNATIMDTSFPRCVQFVRGSFYYDYKRQSSKWAELEPARTILHDGGAYLASQPNFFFEGEFVPGPASGSLTIRPIAVYLAKPIGSRTFRSNDERSIAMFFAITKPGEKASLEQSPAASLNLGKLKSGVIRQYSYDGNATASPWDAPWFLFASEGKQRPVTFNALETETQDESKFLTFIAGLLTDDTVKSKITTELQQAFIPSVAAAAQAEETSNVVKLENAQADAYGKALVATVACRDAAGGTDDQLRQVADAASSALRTFVEADQALPSGNPKKLNSLTLAYIDGSDGKGGGPKIEGIDRSKPKSVPAKCGEIYAKFLSVAP